MIRRIANRWLVVLSLSACVVMPLSAAGAPTVQDLVDEVSQAQYASYVLSVENMGLGLFDPNYNQGYRSRAIWSDGRDLGNRETEAYLAQQFSDMGLSVTVQGQYKNVIGRLTGTVTPDRVYIVSGHYDTDLAYSQSSRKPGGDDNASGVAGVLETARVLSQYQFGSTILFVGWNGEERGEWGSYDYVDNVAKNAGDPGHQDIAGMMALDMILRPGNNVSPNAPLDLDVITQPVPTGQDLDWANAFIDAASTYVPSLATDLSGGRGTDHKPFYDAGYAAFWLGENTLSELMNGANGYYHTREDATDGLANDPNSPSGFTFDYPFATDVVRATVATIAQEAQIVPEPATLALLTVGGLALIRRR